MSINTRLVQKKFADTTEEAVVGLLLVAGMLDGRIEQACAEQGITAVQYNVLRILRGVHPEGHPRCDVARRLIARAPDVTRLIDRLERRGLVERGWHKNNRRLSIATITRSGLDLLATLDPAIARIQHAATSGLSKADLRELTRLCNLMLTD